MVKNWNRSLGELVLTNDSRIKLFSAEEPERLRGPQHHGAWCDELAAWARPETWDQLQFGLRLGATPKVVVTTTPKPTPLIRQLTARDNVLVTRGSTFDNAANLSPAALLQLRDRYEGTRMGRQELYGEILEDVEGALWTNALIDSTRVAQAPELSRIVVAIDPAVTTGENSDSTGIVGVGKGVDGHAYVLHDRTCRDTPAAWARRAIQLWHDMGEIGPIVGEANQGGDLIEATIRAVEPNVPYRKVNARQGKRLRAEPIAALFEQGRVHMVGTLPELEDEMTGWLPDSGYSPDRLDAMVHAIAELKLAIGSSADAFFESLMTDCPECHASTRTDLPLCETCHTPIGVAS
jgi:phage terminase large subunit-like protein